MANDNQILGRSKARDLGRVPGKSAAAVMIGFTGGYVIFSALTLTDVIVLSSSAVFANNTPVWIVCALIFASGVVAFIFSLRIHQGARGLVLPMRIIAIAFALAIAIVLALPGRYPTWMRTEQVICVAFLLGAAVTSFISRRGTRG
jgi:xanthine/uracil permease